MAKRTKQRVRPGASDRGAAAPHPRQPCPCGSGRRYKACHGAVGGPAPTFVAKPFDQMPSECDVVALRELVPAASAPLPLRDSDRQVRLCSILPMAVPGLVREDGEILIGLQVQHHFGDPARDLGAVLIKALDAEAGMVGLLADPGDGPRLQDLVREDPLQVTVHDGFGFWFGESAEGQDPEMVEAIKHADASIHPTRRLASVDAAYWTDVGTKEHLRWVMPDPEDALLDALARVHAADQTGIADGSRLVGMFRAHGLLAPVWDLPLGTGAEVLEKPAAAFAERLGEALADASPLTAEQRAARAGLANRQVTIR